MNRSMLDFIQLNIDPENDRLQVLLTENSQSKAKSRRNGTPRAKKTAKITKSRRAKFFDEDDLVSEEVLLSSDTVEDESAELTANNKICKLTNEKFSTVAAPSVRADNVFSVVPRTSPDSKAAEDNTYKTDQFFGISSENYLNLVLGLISSLSFHFDQFLYVIVLLSR